MIVRFARSKLGVAGFVLSSLVIITTLLAPLIAPYGMKEFTEDLMQPPSRTHLLGTDPHGRDLMSRVLFGGRVSLVLAVASLAIAATIGIPLGLVGGVSKGVVGVVLGRIIDMVLAFPSVMIALFVMAVAPGKGALPVILAIGITLMPRFARVIWGATLPVQKEEFIMAASAIGASRRRILVRHILPNLTSPIIVLCSIYLPYVLILEASLSFLGLGAPPDVPSWGRIISEGKTYLQFAPWLTLAPGAAILIAAVGFNLLGDGLRDVFDPKSESKLSRRSRLEGGGG